MLTVLVFTVVQLLPGNIIDVMIGENPEVRAALTKEFGLDQPVNIQCAKWVGRLMQGNLGTSLITWRDIGLELFDRIAATAYLAMTDMILSMMIAIPLGTLAALKRYTYIDNGVQVITLTGISILELWYAIMAILLFSLHLGWLPSSGYTDQMENIQESIVYLILPAIAIGFHQAA